MNKKLCIFIMNYFHFLSKYPKPGLLRQSCHSFCIGSPQRFYRPLRRSFDHFKNQRYGSITNRILLSQKNINEIHRNGRMFSNESDQQVNFDDISEGKKTSLFFYFFLMFISSQFLHHWPDSKYKKWSVDDLYHIPYIPWILPGKKIIAQACPWHPQDREVSRGLEQFFLVIGDKPTLNWPCVIFSCNVGPLNK